MYCHKKTKDLNYQGHSLIVKDQHTARKMNKAELSKSCVHDAGVDRVAQESGSEDPWGVVRWSVGHPVSRIVQCPMNNGHMCRRIGLNLERIWQAETDF